MKEKGIEINWNEVDYKERPVMMAKILSEFVNGACSNYTAVADTMATEHRYLQQEMFKLFFEYAKTLAHNKALNRYDPRNKWACETATLIFEALKEKDQLYSGDIEYALEGKERRKW